MKTDVCSYPPCMSLVHEKSDGTWVHMTSRGIDVPDHRPRPKYEEEPGMEKSMDPLLNADHKHAFQMHAADDWALIFRCSICKIKCEVLRSVFMQMMANSVLWIYGRPHV